jgi:DNA-binding MarR family transcriptional regulator
MNITITLNLSKSEFYFTEPITGYLNISNNNSFDITLGNPVYIQEGEHFTIQSLQNLSRYYGFFTNQFFPIIIKSKDLKIIEFKIDRYLILPIKSQYNNYTQLSAGNYSVFIDLYYGINTNFTKIKSNIETFRIIENESVINGTTELNPGNGYNGLSQSFIVYSTVAVIVIILLIITTFIAGTEIGKYTFFGGIVPLYTKTRRKKLDKNYGYKKGLVLGYILGTPGESYNAIKRVLNLNNGVLAYYLRVLEREEAIKSERDGMYKRFYPTRGNITKEVLELTDVQKDIYKTIKEHLGITQKEISSLLGVTQSKVNYHVKMMVDARLLRMDREGKRTRCFILEEDSQEV